MKQLILLLILLTSFSLNMEAQMIDTKAISLEDAKRVLEAAKIRANQDNWTVVIAVVDAGGHLIALERIDNTQVGSIEVAIKKAKTAVYFKRSTKVFQDGIAAGNTHMLGLPEMVPFEGGLPIFYNGKVIGAIGVSGVTSAQDGVIAQAGLDAL